MKFSTLAAAICVLIIVAFVPILSSAQMFTHGIARDWAFFDQYYPAPCYFPPVVNPCQAPCRSGGFQPQTVPCPIKTACPSRKLPCHGFAYGTNPYPIFR
jgi:hypothetical protein